MAFNDELEIRIKDLIRLSERQNVPKYYGFLSLSEKTDAVFLLKGTDYGFYGGYDDAERTVLGVFPQWYKEDFSDYPTVCLNFSFNKAYKLSHRDFLGALTSLGITRKSIGDILVGDGYAVVFVLENIADFIVSQITKIGNTGVSVRVCEPKVLPKTGELKDFTATVASLRIDCVVSALIGKGRKESAELIEKDAVAINSVIVRKLTHSVRSGDTVSVRKYGKFIISDTSGVSKKGRIILNWQKYV